MTLNRVLLIALLASVASASSSSTFSVTLSPPAGTSESAVLTAITFRAYERWDGTEKGWSAIDSPPRAGAVGGELLDMGLTLGYDGSGQGSVELGIDQFAHYFAPQGTCSMTGELCKGHDGCTAAGSECVVPAYGAREAVVEGTWGPVGYYSMNVKWQDPATGEMTELYTVDAEWPAALGGEPNPYVKGNETVFAQFANATAARAAAAPAAGRAAPASKAAAGGGTVALYRPDKQTSSGLGFDGAVLDDCADTYVSTMQSYDSSKAACEPHGVSPPVGNYSFLVLRAKLPRVLVAFDTASPDAIFGEYDARYFSVGSHVCGAYGADDDAELAWWTVNARMLAASVDGDGVGTVFFVPRDDARALQVAQGRDAWDAPELSWGDALAGRVLGTPDLAVILRYRVPSAAWEGSPANAPCFANPLENQPLEADALGEYTPEIYGCNFDSLDEFLAAPSCGPLSK